MLIKIGNDLDLLQRVRERFDLDGEIVLQKYNDSWGEWVDVSCPEICHMDKIKVVRLADVCKIETFGWIDRRRRQSGASSTSSQTC